MIMVNVFFFVVVVVFKHSRAILEARILFPMKLP